MKINIFYTIHIQKHGYHSLVNIMTYKYIDDYSTNLEKLGKMLDVIKAPKLTPQSTQNYTVEVSLEELYSGAIKKIKISNDGKEEIIKLDVPAGCPNNKHFKITTDITIVMITIKQKKHDIFERYGDTLYARFKKEQLQYKDQLTIPTLNNEFVIINLAMMRPSYTFLDKGMPAYKMAIFGVLYVIIE